jgi:hypothetical protein
MADTAASFDVREHWVSAQHVRHYSRATIRGANDTLFLAVKIYKPKTKSPIVPSRSVSILATSGNGFPKELYEPLWCQTLQDLHGKGVNLESIVIADVAHEGMSGLRNAHLLGDRLMLCIGDNVLRVSICANDDTASFEDRARDLLCVVNHLRAELGDNLIGVGHSIGTAAL